jgi:hypothetical protein
VWVDLGLTAVALEARPVECVPDDKLVVLGVRECERDSRVLQVELEGGGEFSVGKVRLSISDTGVDFFFSGLIIVEEDFRLGVY